MDQTEQYPYLIVVDVQRGYEDSIGEKIYDIIHKINNTNQQIILFYVGKDLNLDSKEDVIFYLLEHGLNEDRIDDIKFMEKTYGYFRTWMDLDIPEEYIINGINLMAKNKIYDSRDFTDEDMIQITNGEFNKNIRLTEIMTGDHIFYPGDFNVNFFKTPELDKFEIIGGGRYECLKEIELFLTHLNKEFTTNESLCYGAELETKKNKKKKRNFI